MKTLQLVAATTLVAGAVACASSDDETRTPNPSPAPSQASPSGSGPAATGAVHELRALAGNHWSVGALTLKAGDSVKVIDADNDVPHNFVVDGVGRSETMNGGDEFRLTFPNAGTFAFVCTFHENQGMKGTITVS